MRKKIDDLDEQDQYVGSPTYEPGDQEDNIRELAHSLEMKISPHSAWYRLSDLENLTAVDQAAV